MWLSGVDINTQQSFEALSDRYQYNQICAATIIIKSDSIFAPALPQGRSGGGGPHPVGEGQGRDRRLPAHQPEQKPSIQALIHGLNRSALNKYDFRFSTNPIYHHFQALLLDRHQLPKTELELTMLMNLHKKNWVDGLTLRWGTNAMYTEI